jgi:hypothetical protein
VLRQADEYAGAAAPPLCLQLLLSTPRGRRGWKQVEIFVEDSRRLH